MNDPDSQVREASHSDELREKTKVNRDRTRAPDGRGRRLDDNVVAQDEAAEDAPSASKRGEPGVRKSSS